MIDQGKKIVVLRGGPSSERDVSLRTGAAVAEALRSLGYQIQEVDPSGPDFELPNGTDFVFISLHGAFGEDGQLQAILEKRGVGYTGCGPKSSALAFDKEASKQAFIAAGVPTPRGEILYPGDVCSLNAPLVFKPACQGSSIGLEIVLDPTRVPEALKRSREHGDVIVAESFVRGRELTVGILDGVALPVVEIRPKAGVYDYTTKYTAGATEYLCPAPLSSDETLKVQHAALEAHRSLGCEVYSRVDVILDEQGNPWVLEVNTIPGMTATSLLPKAARAFGVEFPQLCETILKTSYKLRGGVR